MWDGLGGCTRRGGVGLGGDYNEESSRAYSPNMVSNRLLCCACAGGVGWHIGTPAQQLIAPLCLQHAAGQDAAWAKHSTAWQSAHLNGSSGCCPANTSRCSNSGKSPAVGVDSCSMGTCKGGRGGGGGGVWGSECSKSVIRPAVGVDSCSMGTCNGGGGGGGGSECSHFGKSPAVGVDSCSTGACQGGVVAKRGGWEGWGLGCAGSGEKSEVVVV